jgi:hypothetical protein
VLGWHGWRVARPLRLPANALLLACMLASLAAAQANGGLALQWAAPDTQADLGVAMSAGF